MIRAIVLALVALAVTDIAYPPVIRRLKAIGIGQRIREEGPAAHKSKAGTPTAGGIVFVVIAVLVYAIGDRSAAGGLVALALVSGGGIGLIDDLRKIRGGSNLGLRAREKIVVQMLVGAALGFLAWRWGFQRQAIPFDGTMAPGPWLIIIGLVAFTAGSNAFNLTDGSDGLSAGAGALVFATLALLALLAHHPSAALMPAVLVGALAGFLIYNRYPARIFMGDTGSLGLGTAMVASAMVTGFLWYLPLLALVFVAETVSVILQVASFKTTGRRILKMSPLHHHFHLLGWSENRVATWSFAVTLAAAVLTVAIARPGSLS